MSVITIERKVLEKNEQLAQRNRDLFREHGIIVLNFVSSPGAGKTSILEKTFQELRGRREHYPGPAGSTDHPGRD